MSDWLRCLFGLHEWQDAYVFDSCIQVTIPTGERRVLGQAVMMGCAHCNAMKRRPLKTWTEARIARRKLRSLAERVPRGREALARDPG